MSDAEIHKKSPIRKIDYKRKKKGKEKNEA